MLDSSLSEHRAQFPPVDSDFEVRFPITFVFPFFKIYLFIF